jgi:hypothetical protein
MPAHKFQVGEIVVVKSDVMRNVPGGRYEITRQLPIAGEIEYRVKSVNEPDERVVQQRDMTRASEAETTTLDNRRSQSADTPRPASE